MKKIRIVSVLWITLLIFPVTLVLAVSNPYGDLGYGNCTWTAWQLTYERLGIALPGWGGASSWISGAASNGYSTGDVPQANSIVVWAGHVGFVAQTSGNNIYVMEGGYDSSPTGYHEGWYDGSPGTSVWGMSLLGYIYLADVPANCTPVTGTDPASEMAKRNQELTELQIKKASLENQIEETQREIETLSSELASGEEELGQRMRAMYMMGSDSYVEYLFTSKNISEFFTKANHVSQIISAENQQLDEVQRKVDELEQKFNDLLEQQTELESMTI